MGKTLIGLLLASVIATPAVADKGGKGKGGGHHKEFKADRGGGHGGGKQWRGGGGDRARGGWDHGARDARVQSRPFPANYARGDGASDRNAWKEARKERREVRRETRADRREMQRVARQDWRDHQRNISDRRLLAARSVSYVPAQSYYQARTYVPVRYAQPVTRYAQPAYYGADYGYAEPYDFYGDAYSNYPSGQSSLGGGGGLLSALLPIVLSTVFGSDLGSGIGGLTGIGGLGASNLLGGGLTNTAYAENYGWTASPGYNGYDSYSDYGGFSDYGSYAAMSELTGADPYVLPLQQAGYADDLGGGLGSLLVPAVLGQSGGLF